MNLCDDNRIITIEKAKQAMIKGTNIENSPEEMKVLNNILFRCWQMGWLDRYDPQKKQTITEDKIKAWLDMWEGYIDADMIARMKYRVIDIRNVQLSQDATDINVGDKDTISRKAAIEALTKDKKALEHIINGMSGYEKEFDRFVGQRNQVDYDLYAIKQLPPAQPERIKGHWIESNGLNILMKKFIEKGETWRMCDKCGAGFMIGYQYECDKLYHETFHNFCPKCGAEMEVTT